MFIHDNICVLGSTEYIVDANDCLLLTVLCVTHQGSTGLYPGIPTSPKNKNMKWQICLTFSFFLNQNSFIFSFFLNFLYQSTLKWQNYFFYLCFYYKKDMKSYASLKYHMFSRSWMKVYENCLNWCRVLGLDELVSRVNYILEELKSPA